MARKFAFFDGWDCYTDWTWRWDDAWGGYGDAHWYWNPSDIHASGGRMNSGCMTAHSYTGGMRRSRFEANQTWLVGVACKPTLQAGGMHAVTLLYADCPQVGIRIGIDGSLTVFTFTGGGWTYSYYRNYGYPVIGEYRYPVFHANSWNYLEMKVYLHATDGTVEVRANGVETPVISETGVCTIYQGTSWTPTALANGLVLGGYKDFDPNCGACAMAFDDLFVDLGEDAEFRGDCRVYTFLPTGEGEYSEWTPSPSIPNWQNVDEAEPNGDEDYVYEGTPGIRDTYAHDPLPFSPDGATVHCVSVSSCAKKAMPGVAEIAPMVRSNGVDSDGDAFTPVAESYNYYTSFWETDPGDSPAQAWTVSRVNAMQFGQKVIA